MSVPSQSSRDPRACRTIELFVPEIRLLLREKDLTQLRATLAELNPIDLADGFGQFSSEEQLLLFKLLKPGRMMEVFEELDFPQQEYIVQHLEDLTLAPLLQDIPAEVTAKFFKKLPEKTVKRMSSLMNKERAVMVHEILEYPANTVGSVMRTNFIHVSPETTAKATLALLQARTRVRQEEDVHMIFVTNGNRRLLGGVTLRTLIAAPANIQVRDIMSPMSPIRIDVLTDREEAAATFTRYRIMTAPVVDEKGSLVGVLDADDVIQVIEAETTEDIQKLAGVEALESPYFETPFLQMVQKRATWLCVLFLGEMLTATAMAFFEKQIARAVVLALFIPLIISSGGNSGSQAATLIVRAMALKEITLRDWWRVMRREFASGFVLGIVLGCIGFLRIFLWSQFTDLYGPHYMLVAAAVGGALVLVVMWGSLSGSLLPMALRRVGLDPAVVSAPFVATLVDVTGLVIYFSVASLVLAGTML